MSYFLLPIITYKKIRAAAANYWWGSSADNRQYALDELGETYLAKMQRRHGFQGSQEF
jgi:hypothetical protein